MIDPKILPPMVCQDGITRTFHVHKFPAVAGREIVAKYPVAMIPKLGDYAVSEEIMLKLMCFVGVEIEGRSEPLMLTTRGLVDNHTGGWETLATLEKAALEYNCSFFGNGVASASFESIVRKAAPWISRMLTDLSAQSSRPAPPRSTN